MINQGLDSQSTIEFVASAIKSRECELVNVGGSVLLLLYLSAKEAALHFFSLHSAITTTKNIRACQEKILERNIKIVYLHEESPRLIHLLTRLGFLLMPSDKKEFDWMICL